jgi:hypothetical protein
VEKYSIARQYRNGNIIWRMRIACWIPKATITHSEYVILIVFQRQQWLHKRASMLRCAYTAGPVCHQRYNGRQRLNGFDPLLGHRDVCGLVARICFCYVTINTLIPSRLCKQLRIIHPITRLEGTQQNK